MQNIILYVNYGVTVVCFTVALNCHSNRLEWQINAKHNIVCELRCHSCPCRHRDPYRRGLGLSFPGAAGRGLSLGNNVLHFASDGAGNVWFS